MTKRLIISKVLVYYDIPEIFVAIDNVGTNYLCLLVEIKNDTTKYIATAISKGCLERFINGQADLRNIFEVPEINQWFVFDNISQQYIEAVEYNVDVLPQEYLPDEGFIYQSDSINEEAEDEEIIINEVEQRGTTIVHLAVSDQNDSSSIEAETLGNILKIYQVLIEHCYKKTLRQKKLASRPALTKPENYTLRAFESSKGSFNLHLYSTSQTDLLGMSPIQLGLETFDQISQDFDEEEQFIEILRKVKGHVISHFKNLLKNIIENNIKLKHKWFAPNQKEVRYTVINQTLAKKIYAVLNHTDDLTEEKINFEGYFVQVDIKKGTWRIHNYEDQKEYSGEATGVNLMGVTVNTVNYKLYCTETIEEYKVSEKEKKKYKLQTIEPV